MKRVIMGTFAILFVTLFTACGESSSGSTVAVNYAPVATQSLVTKSVTENSNLTYDITLNVTDSDGENNVTYSLQVVIQDIANDSLLTYTVNIVTSIDSNETLSGSIVLTDSDGLSANTIAFDLLDLNDSNLSVYSGTMTDLQSDGNYTFSIDLQASNVGASYYTPLVPKFHLGMHTATTKKL